MSHVDHHDLRKLMVSARVRSPALGAVTSHVEVERLFANFITSNQAEISLPDVERVSQHYGYNRDFAKRCYEQLKRERQKLGAKELWVTLSHHLDELEPDIIKFISDQIAFPHLYRHPQERKGAKIYKSMDSISHAQSTLPLNGKQESGHVIHIKDLCLSYGKMIFSKKMNIGEWWRGFERLAIFAFQTNGFMANFKECGICLTDFIYKYGSHDNVEQKIARLIIEHVLHYKAYVGNPQSEVYMHVILAFARKITSKTLPFLLGLLAAKFKEVKSNSKRCEMIAWSMMQMVPAIAKMRDSSKQQEAVDTIAKFMNTVFREWRANNQGPTRHWTALAYHQLKKYDLDSKATIDDSVMQKAENALSVESWDADELCGGVFPIFEDAYGGDGDSWAEDDDEGGNKKKKKKKKKRKKGKKESEKERKQRERRRKQQIKKGQQQQYKMYGDAWAQMGHSMKSVMSTAAGFGIMRNEDGAEDDEEREEEQHHALEELDVSTKNALEDFQRMKTAQGGDVYDPDREDMVEVNALENEMMDALSEMDPLQKRKEDEKKKLLSLKQKKFFLMDDEEYLNAESNPYHQKIESELSAFKPLIEWDATMIKEWIRTQHFSLAINDEIDDYFPDYMNGYMFLNMIRFPQQVLKENLRESGIKWSDNFENAMWVAAKEFHSKYLLELGINRVGECCGQINALKIESHRLSHILQENDIVYDPDYAKQCVTQELIAPKFEQFLAEEDALHPRWTDSDAKQLRSLYLRLASKLEKETLDLIKNESKYYEAMRKTQIDLRELSTRVDLRYSDLENYNTQLTTQELMLRDLAVKSKHLTMEKNQLLNEYAAAVNEKNYYLRELHINGKLPYIEHLEKLKAEIQRQVDDVTLLDYQKDQIKQTEKHWIDLAHILITVFNENHEKDREEFESELAAQFEADNSDEHHKGKMKGKQKSRKSMSGGGRAPKHRKGQKSTSSAKGGGGGKHRRHNSISKSSVAGGDEIETFSTLHNREDNIDIVCVIQKMFAYYIGEWPGMDKPQFLPDFNAMIDELYDLDASVLHYDPVNIDETSLKRYVQAGKEAKMRELQRKKQEREEMEMAERELLSDEDAYAMGQLNTPEVEDSEEAQLKEKVSAIKQSLGQHTAQKGTGAQLKEMEKKVKTQQRRDRNKKLLEKKQEKNAQIISDTKEEKKVEKEEEAEDAEEREEEKEAKEEDKKVSLVPPPPPAPFHEKLDGDEKDVVIVPPPPPPPASQSSYYGDNTAVQQEKSSRAARHRYKKSMMSAQQMYATQWMQYQAKQQNYAAQYAREQQQYNATWSMFQKGAISKQQWDEYSAQHALKWRKYAYWLQYQQMMAATTQQAMNNNNENNDSGDMMNTKLMKLYEIAMKLYPKKDVDLWFQWKQSKQQHSANIVGNVGMNNIDKMQCMRIDSRVQQIYKAQHPNEEKSEPQSQPQPPLQQRGSLTPQQQQQMFYQYQQQQLMQQRQYQMMQQQQQQQQMQMYRQLSAQSQMVQQQYQQLIAGTAAATAPPQMQSNNTPPLPPPPPGDALSAPESSGNRLRGALESEEKKKERERRRLERKKRRGLQKLQPSAQQKANEKIDITDI